MPTVEAHGLTGADKALMYALGGLARGGATRGGYVSRLPLISLGGAWTGSTAARRVLVASLSISDLLNEVPNTCTFTVQGTRPAEGAPVVIAVGSTAATQRLFAGTILRVTELYVGQNPTAARNILYQCEAIDWTWGLNARLVSARYTAQSATAIARDLLARYAPVGYVGQIAEGLPPIDEITFTLTPLMECFTQLATRIGGYAKCDYFKRVWLWVTLPAAVVPPPRDLTPAHPSLESITYTRDLAPIVTRALVEGGGVGALAPCDPGETRIAVEDTAWYSDTGGYVVSGPQPPIRYTGIVVAGGGAPASSVGGATGNTAPTAGPTITTTPAAGLPTGTYQYAFTWITAAGESLPSPVAPFNTAASGGPTVAPGATPSEGTGLGTGRYTYAYTWVTPTGETLPSATVDADTSAATVAPPASSHAVAAQVGTGLGFGTYYWTVTYTTATGETTRGSGNGVVTYRAAFQDAPQPIVAKVAGAGLPVGTYFYAVTYVTAYGESKVAVTSGTVTISDTASAQVAISGIGIGPAGTTARRVYRTTKNGSTGTLSRLTEIANNTATTFTDTGVPDASLGGPPPATNTAGTPYATALVTGIPIGPAGVTGRKLYRSAVGGNGTTDYRLVATLANNTTTSYTDALPDASRGAALPTTNTTTINAKQVQVSGIAVGPSGVTARKLYRTAVGATALQLVATIADNATTGYTDAAPDAALGAAAPVTATAVLAQAVLSAIAVGPPQTTARKVYRTPVNSAALQLLATIANNTATTLPADAAADTALGAAAPTKDTSGLPSQSLGGVVPAGADTIPVASSDPFSPEGWAEVGGQYIRYHGVTAAPALTGIPATGAGSLGVSIPYNTPIVVLPQITGIPASGAGAVTAPILPGDEVNLLAIADDLPGQAALAAALGGPPADGIVESYLQDRRISQVEADARAAAVLELKATVRETVRYRVRDPLTQSGVTITVDLPPPMDIHGTYQIQDVTIGNFLGVPGVNPTYDVVASSDRFTFEDLIRQRRAEKGD